MRGALCSQSLLIPSTLPPSSSSLPRIALTPPRRWRLPPSPCSTSVIVTTTESDTSPSVSKPFLPRRLILLRHAESSWEDRSLRDHDRHISTAGRDDAASVATKLLEMGWVPEVILSSDATRTKETLEIMCAHAQVFSKAKVHFVPSFYSVAAMDGQTAEHLQKAICQYCGDEILTTMCMGHNKGWEEAASIFSGESIDLKTCNAALLESAGVSWEQAFTSSGFGGWKLHCVIRPTSKS